MNRALILIDIQNDYFPGGRMELPGSLAAGALAGSVLASFRKASLPVVHIQHVSTRPTATYFLPGTDGTEIHASVKPLPGEPVFIKHYPNSFRDTPLLAYLKERNIQQLVICGMMTNMCVDATTRAAFDHGFECCVITDACAARPLTLDKIQVPAEQVHAAFLAALGSVYARLTSAEAFLKSFSSGDK